jgi:hypothetical protein
LSTYAVREVRAIVATDLANAIEADRCIPAHESCFREQIDWTGCKETNGEC